MIFDNNLLEKTVYALLKTLSVRLGVVLFSFMLVYYTRPGLVGSLLIYLVPLMLLQVWIDNRFSIPKQISLAVWVVALFIVSYYASYWGIIGLVTFYLVYFIYRYFKVRKTSGLKAGIDLIKNAGTIGEEASEHFDFAAAKLYWYKQFLNSLWFAFAVLSIVIIGILVTH